MQMVNAKLGRKHQPIPQVGPAEPYKQLMQSPKASK